MKNLILCLLLALAMPPFRTNLRAAEPAPVANTAPAATPAAAVKPADAPAVTTPADQPAAVVPAPEKPPAAPGEATPPAVVPPPEPTKPAAETAPAPVPPKPAEPVKPPSPAPVVAKLFQLPVFEDGPWKGKFLVYENANFDATMDAYGNLEVQPKYAGKPVGKSFTFGDFGMYYAKPEGDHNVLIPRRMVSVEKLTGPLTQPAKLVLKGKFDDDVAFTRLFEFQNNRIQFSVGFKDPKDIVYASCAGVGICFPASHTIPNAMQQAQREEILKGCVLETREHVGKMTKRVVHPYAKMLQFAGTVEEAIIVGPWGPRKVKIDARNLRDLVMYGSIYQDFCPWEGYSFGFHPVNGDLAPNYRLVLVIE